MEPQRPMEPANPWRLADQISNAIVDGMNAMRHDPAWDVRQLLAGQCMALLATLRPLDARTSTDGVPAEVWLLKEAATRFLDSCLLTPQTGERGH